MVKQRDIAKAFGVACAAAAGVVVCSVIVLQRSAADEPGPKVESVAAFIDYVSGSALFAGAFAGAASLLLEKTGKQRRYTLDEVSKLAIESGADSVAVTQVVGELMSVMEKESDQ